MKRGLAIGLVVAVLVGLVVYRLAAIYFGGRATQQFTQALQAPLTVEVGSAANRTLTLDFDPVGTVVAPNSVDLASKTNGHILFLKVRQGDRVSKGQVLVKIDDAEADDEVVKAEGQLANARYTYYQQLAQQQLTNVQASSSVLKAAADLDAAQAELNKARQVYRATVSASRASLAEAESKVVSAQAQERLALVDYEKGRVHYDRMLELQRQGFASQADVYDSYQDLLSKKASIDRERAQLAAARAALANARQQGSKENVGSFASIQQSRFDMVSKQAGLTEAEAGTARSLAYTQQLRAQKALVESAEAELWAARTRLAACTIRSPIDGFVADRKLDVGSLASPGATILTVQSSGRMWVVVPAPQEVYSRLKIGLPAEVSIDGVNDEKPMPGKVVYKDRSVDAASRQFNLRIQLSQVYPDVRPGMYARVKLPLGEVKDVLSVPTSALYKKDPEKRSATVYQVIGAKVKVLTVSYGPSDGKYTSIISGLAGGESVVVESAQELQEGQEVKPVEDRE